jgi:hypothetical protein
VSKRRIRLDEQDLKDFLGSALRSSGYMNEDAQILGFEYKTKKIKKGGDYYADGVADKDYPGEVEEVVWIKVLTETKGKKEREEPALEPEQP